MISNQEAKELPIKVWEFHVAYPKRFNKSKIYEKIKHFNKHCPLCKIFNPPCGCHLCPIKDCYDRESAYSVYKIVSIRKKRAAANEILCRIKAWEVEE